MKTTPRILTGSAAALLRKTQLILAAASALGFATAEAATIAWGTVTAVVGDSDVSTLGTLDRAELFGGGSTTVNGVTFSQFSSSGDTANFGNQYNGYGTGSPFNTLSASYQTLLTNGYYQNGTTGTITLNSINVGLDYELEFWVNDSRGCCSGRSETVSGSGSMAYSTIPGGTGGVGSFVKGTFTGDGTTQALSISANASAQVNGLQLRTTGVAAGNTATVTAPRNWTTLATGAGSTLNYNLASSFTAATTITGSGTLQKSGTATLTLSGASTYSGATNITNGTLRVAVASGSTLWLDAAKTSSLTTSGNSVTQWSDAGGGTNFASQSNPAAQPLLATDNAFAGPAKSIVDLGATGNSGQWLQFNNNITDIRSVFWVMKGGGFLLGSTGAYDFHRDDPQNNATSNIWNATYTNGNIQNGQTYLNGTLVNGTTTPLSTNYQMVDVITNGNVQSNALANDRNISGRVGGQQIGEVIIFNKALTTTERQQVETYLNYKWFGTGAGVGNLLPVATPVTISGGGSLDLSGVNYQTIGSLSSSDPTSRVTLGSATLTVGDANSTIFDGVISEGGALVKTGSGMLTLTNANTYSGTTTISNGTLQLSGTAGSLGTNAGPITNNGTLRFNRSNALAFGNVIAGTGAVAQTGTGTTTLTGANAYTGATSVTNGRLQLNGGAAGALTTSSLTVSGGAALGFTAGTATTLNLGANPFSLGGTVAFDIGASGVNDAITAGSFTLTANSAFTFNAVGAIANAASYTLLTSTSAITTNGFTISGQTVGRLTLTPVINANTVTVTPSLFQGIWNQAGGGVWSNGNANGPSGGNWTNYKPTVSGDAALFGAAITAAATVNVDSAHSVGYIAFNNANAYTIGTPGSSNLTLNNGAANALVAVSSGSHVIAENVALASGVSIAPAVGTTLTVSGDLSGAGGVQLVSGGTLVLSGTNAHTGGTTAGSGVIKAGSTSAFGSSTASVTVNAGGAIDVNDQLLAQQPTINGTGVDANTGAIFTTGNNFNSGFAALTLGSSASIGNNGGRFDIGRTAGSTTQGNGFTLTKVGNNLVGIQAAATNLGGVVINAGTLQPENDAAFGSAPVTINNSGTLAPWGGRNMSNAITINAGGTLRENQGFNDTYTGPVTLGGAGTIDTASGDITISGAVSGGGSLTKTGNSTLTLSGANSHGTTVVNAGILKAGNDSALGASGASVTVNSGGSIDINSRTLQGYTQNISIAGAGASPTLGALGNTNASNNLNAIRGIVLTADASIGGDGGRWDIGRLDFNADPNISVAHIDANNFVLTKVGSGYLGLLTASLNLGGFIINGGTVAPHENSSFGTGPVTVNAGTILQPWGGLTLINALTVDGGTLQTDGFTDTYTGGMSVGAGGVTFNNGNGDIVMNSVISGAGTITKSNGSTLRLTAANTQTGPVFISGGNMRLASAGGPAILGNVTFTQGGFTVTESPNQFGPTTTLTFNSGGGHAEVALYGNNQTVAGISSTNQFAVIQNSHAAIGPASASSVLTIVQNFDSTYSGYIRDNTNNDAFTLAIVKSGTGTLTLDGAAYGNGAITYSGGTTINGGTIALNTGGGKGTLPDGGAVVINSGGTLRANATDALGTVNHNAGNGVFVNEGGVLTVAVGNRASMDRDLTVTGGTVTSVGAGDGSGGSYSLRDTNGSVLTFTSSAGGTPATLSAQGIGLNGTATFNVTDGPGAVDLNVTGNIVDNFITGSLIKAGAGTMVIAAASPYTGTTAVNAGTLDIEAAIGAGANVVNANGGETIFGVSQTLAELNIADGALVTLGAPAAAPAPLLQGVAAVPEPGSVSLLLLGALGLLGRRRRLS